MQLVINDGGRSKYFKAENVGDCVTRAICNATGKDYLEVYNRLKEMARRESTKRHRGHKKSSVRDGVFKETWKRYLKEIGWVHHSVTSIGDRSSRMKLTEEDLPMGNLIVQISKHLTNVKDHVIYDTYDCSRKEYYDEFGNLQVNTERCVYGYWTAPSEEQVKAKEEQEALAKQLEEKQQEAIQDTKAKIEAIKKSHEATIKKLEKKLKEVQHALVIERNRMNREIKKIKEEDSRAFLDTML